MKLIECPRDAMQGLQTFIQTETKADYINQLLKAGFHTIDFGSFVSPKAVPQMRDTAEVLNKLTITPTSSKLLAIIANLRGAEDASRFEEITYLGFPLSLSETFQKRNTNKTLDEAFKIVEDANSVCTNSNKKLVVYLSMGFGNPYDDPYNPEFVLDFVRKLDKLGIQIISLSDTVGVADKETIQSLFSSLIAEYPKIEFGAHFHSHPSTVSEKLEAAYNSGCRRFDSAINGIGGCPMAKDELIGNLSTQKVVKFFQNKGIKLDINETELDKAVEKAGSVFPLQ